MDLKRFLKTMRLIFICHSGSFLTFQPGFATDPEYGGQPTFFNNKYCKISKLAVCGELL